MLEEYPRKVIYDGGKVTIVIQTQHEMLCERFGVPEDTPEETVLQMWADLQSRGEAELQQETEREAALARLKEFRPEEVLGALSANPDQTTTNDILVKLTQAISDIQLTKGLT